LKRIFVVVIHSRESYTYIGVWCFNSTFNNIAIISRRLVSWVET